VVGERGSGKKEGNETHTHIYISDKRTERNAFVVFFTLVYGVFVKDQKRTKEVVE
jgi:hypothetical protein